MGNFTKNKFTDKVFGIAEDMEKINSNNKEMIDCKHSKNISKEKIEKLYDCLNDFMNDNIEDCCRKDFRVILGKALSATY